MSKKRHREIIYLAWVVMAAQSGNSGARAAVEFRLEQESQWDRGYWDGEGKWDEVDDDCGKRAQLFMHDVLKRVRSFHSGKTAGWCNGSWICRVEGDMYAYPELNHNVFCLTLWCVHLLQQRQGYYHQYQSPWMGTRPNCQTGWYPCCSVIHY